MLTARLMKCQMQWTSLYFWNIEFIYVSIWYKVRIISSYFTYLIWNFIFTILNSENLVRVYVQIYLIRHPVWCKLKR